jgi:hypothetical protein
MKTKQQVAAEQATGCSGAGDYALWAKQQGYPFCQVWDWTSSAGDWTFLVSQDGNEWFWMTQTNNFPFSGFTRTIDKSHSYTGSWEEVQSQITMEFLRLTGPTTAKEKWLLACEWDEVDPNEKFVVFSEGNPYL